MSQQPPGQGWGGAPGQGWGGSPEPRSAGVPGAGAARPRRRGHSRAALGRRGRAGPVPARRTAVLRRWPAIRAAALRWAAVLWRRPGRPGGQSAGPAAGGRPFATQQFPAAEPKGFLGALFDFSFTSFVTPKVVKVLYILIVVVVGLSAVGFALSVLATNVGLGLIVLLIGAPLYFLVVTALYRITLEFFMVIYRMAQDIRAIRERGDFR